MPHKFKEGFLSYYEEENHERMFVLARMESVSDEQKRQREKINIREEHINII